MDRNTKILIGVLVVGAAAGAGYYFLVIRKRATLSQYDEFKTAALESGFNIEADMNPPNVMAQKTNWIKRLTKEDAQHLIDSAIARKGTDKDQELEEQTATLLEKWTGKPFIYNT